MKTFLSSFALLTLFVAPFANAADFQAAEELTISERLLEDSYVAGGKVRIDNSVQGDLVVVGGEIKVNSTVSQDLAIVGGEIDVAGTISDDLRIAGGQVTIDSVVNGDLLVAGGEVTIEQGARIRGDVIVAAGEVTIYAPIDGDLQIHAGSAKLYSTVGGSIKVYAEEVMIDGSIAGSAKIVSGEISYTEDSSIKGDLEYWLGGGAEDFEPLVSGTVTFNESLGITASEAAVVSGGIASIVVALLAALSIYKLLSGLFIIVLLVFAKKTYFPNAAKECMTRPWMNLLIGVLFFIATPFVALMFMITVIGIPIGFSVVAMYIVALLFAKALASVTLAQWYALHKKKKWSSLRLVGASLLVYAALTLLVIIPIIGWIAAKGLILLGFGACVSTEYKMFLKVR
ncbi:hypothetical protein HOK40_00885 [Candidatus Peregrinibacteria bacterium]|jgi:cytoskeletal protein CcmA (bactofilin family)|nr:hypothetical protein [Candidatus Peregrinibacteria bacterium]